MIANGRNQNGRFATGNCGGPGRPPLARERKYLETMSTVCTDADWQAICQRAVADAKQGDWRAREWLSRYLVPEPQIAMEVNHAHAHINLDETYEGPSREVVIDALRAVNRLKAISTGDGA